jgi:hypothetical protein
MLEMTIAVDTVDVVPNDNQGANLRNFNAAYVPLIDFDDVDKDDGLSRSQFYSIFDVNEAYDYSPDECWDTEVEELNIKYCPAEHEKGIPCESLDTIRKWCQKQLLKDEEYEAGVHLETSLLRGSVEGKDAMEGCLKFVGAHIVEHGHYACCKTTDICEEVINEQVAAIYQDEDDDNYDDAVDEYEYEKDEEDDDDEYVQDDDDYYFSEEEF